MVHQKFRYANTLGQDHLSQRWRSFNFLGPHNNFFRKKSCFLNNLSLDPMLFSPIITPPPYYGDHHDLDHHEKDTTTSLRSPLLKTKPNCLIKPSLSCDTVDFLYCMVCLRYKFSHWSTPHVWCYSERVVVHLPESIWFGFLITLYQDYSERSWGALGMTLW